MHSYMHLVLVRVYLSDQPKQNHSLDVHGLHGKAGLEEENLLMIVFIVAGLQGQSRIHGPNPMVVSLKETEESEL